MLKKIFKIISCVNILALFKYIFKHVTYSNSQTIIIKLNVDDIVRLELLSTYKTVHGISLFVCNSCNKLLDENREAGR